MVISHCIVMVVIFKTSFISYDPYIFLASKLRPKYDFFYLMTTALKSLKWMKIESMRRLICCHSTAKPISFSYIVHLPNENDNSNYVKASETLVRKFCKILVGNTQLLSLYVLCNCNVSEIRIYEICKLLCNRYSSTLVKSVKYVKLLFLKTLVCKVVTPLEKN